MNSVAKSMVSAVVALGSVWVLACNGTPAVAQAIVASDVQPAAGGAGCNSPEPFVWVPQGPQINPYGPDTNLTSNIVETGTGDVVISCSVIPCSTSGSNCPTSAPPNAYDVQLVAQITGGSTPGTMTVSGVFLPRPRDANGNPNADATTVMQNITADFLDPTKHLRETDCTAQYELDNNGSAGASLPGIADTYADDKGGRIWASVFCPKPQNLLESQKPGNAGCETSMTFRFENCTSKPSN